VSVANGEKMVKTPFILAALKILETSVGHSRCHSAGQVSTLRKAWTLEKLMLWESTEGVEVSGIPTLAHWRSYTLGE
jgi:hypothetical protein